jgi:glycosyltransferase involved in cell wall biosynthesis
MWILFFTRGILCGQAWHSIAFQLRASYARTIGRWLFSPGAIQCPTWLLVQEVCRHFVKCEAPAIPAIPHLELQEIGKSARREILVAGKNIRPGAPCPDFFEAAAGFKNLKLIRQHRVIPLNPIEFGQPYLPFRVPMKSLYFAAHQFWPPNSGARLRNYQLARQLAVRSSVTFLEMRSAGDEQFAHSDDSGVANVLSLVKGRTYTPSKIFWGLAGPTPVTVLNCWSRRSASRLFDVLKSQQFDSVQIAGTQLIAYLAVLRELPQCPAIVIDWHNIESELMWRYADTTGNWVKQIAANRTARLIQRAEDRLLETCGPHTVTSERERRNLLARCPGANIHVIPNGVDTTYYSPTIISKACRSTAKTDLKRTILFVGSMDYHANIDAVIQFSRTAWLEIAQNHPDLHFIIVGRDPTPEVLALSSDRIHVTGTVDDVRPFYASATAVVVPLRSGSGTRIKILEAMAAGVPVVSTKLGAEGIDIEDGLHYLQADSGPEIAAAVHLIASSEEIRSRLSQAARELVCRTYDWSVIGERLYGIHRDLVPAQQRPSAKIAMNIGSTQRSVK